VFLKKPTNGDNKETLKKCFGSGGRTVHIVGAPGKKPKDNGNGHNNNQNGKGSNNQHKPKPTPTPKHKPTKNPAQSAATLKWVTFADLNGNGKFDSDEHAITRALGANEHGIDMSCSQPKTNGAKIHPLNMSLNGQRTFGPAKPPAPPIDCGFAPPILNGYTWEQTSNLGVNLNAGQTKKVQFAMKPTGTTATPAVESTPGETSATPDTGGGGNQSADQAATESPVPSEKPEAKGPLGNLPATGQAAVLALLTFAILSAVYYGRRYLNGKKGK
jgi:hypothetical protein